MGRNQANIGSKERVADRRQKAFEYRKAGLSLRAIAERLEVSKTTIENDLDAVYKEVVSQTESSIEHHRNLQGERLESYLLALAAPARSGNIKAIEECRKIVAQLSRLYGLNKERDLMVADDDDVTRGVVRLPVVVASASDWEGIAKLQEARERAEKEAKAKA